MFASAGEQSETAYLLSGMRDIQHVQKADESILPVKTGIIPV